MNTKETPIILTTEKVVYSEMNEREKQIYDEAELRGYKMGREMTQYIKKRTIMSYGFIIGFLSGAIFAILLSLN